ncbi:MAG: DNA primase [Bacteroidaceae bacterium]|nr:DNA primase [Bacteroidaceae bacterium]
MIPQSTIDRIVDAANIVDVVSDYVTLRRAGASYKGLCPFHDDKTPSFSVSPARGVCKCFSCGKGGNAVHFIMEIEQMSYVEALKHLAKKYGIPVEEEEMTDEQRQKMNERESMFAVNEWAAKYFSQTMMTNQDGRAIGLAYFRSRGFRDDIIAKFRLGFCLDSPDAVSKEAKAKGYNEKYLVDTGLCIKRDNGSLYDRFRGRAMFPWIAVNGKVVAFGGRVLDARTKGVNQKYVNSPDSLIYHKANELYGIFQAKKQIAKEDMVYMVEGYTDVLAMHQCGIENVVANSGTALNEAQIHLLHRFTNNITLLYDSDEAGIHAATRSTDMLLAEGMNVKILLLPEGDDPDSFSRKHNAQEFKAYVAEHQTDFILFKTNLLLKDAQRDPIKRAQLTEDIVKSIAVIPDEIIRSTYVHECAEILNMDEAILMRGANKNRSSILENLKKEAQREIDRQNRLLNNGTDNAGTDNSPATGTSSSSPATDTPVGADDSFSAITAESDTTQQPSDAGHTGLDFQNIITKQSQSEQRFLGIERMILTLVTRYGEQPLTSPTSSEEGEEATSIEFPAEELTLAEGVQNDLDYDGITLRSPLYARMLRLTCEHVHDEGFIASKFLLNNQDEDISREAADLIDDRYQLSSGNQMEKSEEELKLTYISRLLCDYKNAIIEEELKQYNANLTLPEVKDNPTLLMDTMRHIKELGEIQRQLAKRLGDRVVVK